MSRDKGKFRRRQMDMSLPPEERHRKRKKGGQQAPRPIAQMDHASSSRARKHAADGERKMAREWSSCTASDRYWARFGDAYHQLPGHCWLAPPERVPEPRYGQWPGTQYAGLAGDLLGRGVPVPDHPGACGTPGCGHGILYHRQRTRTKPCQVAGCACADLVRQDVNRRNPAA